MKFIGILVDILLVSAVAIQIVRYTKNGFVRSFLTILQSIVSFVLATALFGVVGEYISDVWSIHEGISNILAFIIIYVLSYIAFSILTPIVDKCFKLPLIDGINKMLGFILGSIISIFNLVLICSLATHILKLFQISTFEMQDASVIYRFFGSFDIIGYLIRY